MLLPSQRANPANFFLISPLAHFSIFDRAVSNNLHSILHASMRAVSVTVPKPMLLLSPFVRWLSSQCYPVQKPSAEWLGGDGDGDVALTE